MEKCGDEPTLVSSWTPPRAHELLHQHSRRTLRRLARSLESLPNALVLVYTRTILFSFSLFRLLESVMRLPIGLHSVRLSYSYSSPSQKSGCIASHRLSESESDRRAQQRMRPSIVVTRAAIGERSLRRAGGDETGSRTRASATAESRRSPRLPARVTLHSSDRLGEPNRSEPNGSGTGGTDAASSAPM